MSNLYIGTTQAAFRLQLSPQRVRKLAIEGRIEGAVKEGRGWKIPVFNGMPKISCKEKGPKGRWRKRRQEVMTFIHVNQTEIRDNRKNKTKHPVISVKRGSRSVLCNEVKIPGFGRIIYDPEHPKNCGATVWLEVEPHIELQVNRFA
ncbi:DNA-binding protein [Crocosphaera sp. XPORK-15E]|uniref:DNA-binding protein n=1 Tax=Crocosphaera sp. XPORK-15E TaxID=3110247 RepID=UPI002B2155F2|nr:DNA-binding protein [Crocosphaera sp. XPORK-15E]MEA5536564.1 DNA-binding protein [Crocosphaera sp. XPORK-15E]